LATLEEIAQRAGVSRNTVARALCGETKATWASTARRVAHIRRIAKDLGYLPNAAAQATRRGRFRAFTLLLSTQGGRSNLPIELLDGILDAMAGLGLHLNIAKIPDEVLTDAAAVPKLLTSWASDGLLVNYTHRIPEQMTTLIREHRVPAVWINSKQSQDCVRPDDFGAARLATEHLLGLGHRRVVYVDYSHSIVKLGDAHYSALDRAAGYSTAMESAGLPPRIIRQPKDTPMFTRETSSAGWLSESRRPTAVVCQGTGTLLPLYAACRGLGIDIPRDLSIVDIGVDAPVPLLVTPTLALVDEKGVGRVAVEMLVRKVAAPSSPQKPLRVASVLRLGNSTAEPRRRDRSGASDAH
jgi:LacI family transcriptional regulator